MRRAGAARSGPRTASPASGRCRSGSRQLRRPGRRAGTARQTAGRSKAAVTDWLDTLGQEWKDAVAVVAMDPCASYRAAVREALPHALIVADHFHLVRLANQALTDVRRRVTWDTHGRRGRKHDPAWAARRRLLRGP
ncbi:transposase [Modestobacter sp. DSM 44400]|uniref:transposase n=1 Tax=Modestobacter sp. DSM 44400 TaxID=1550230 RepID=UPI001586F9BF|nr:transposase [Modestobacter sp. DSM 44400]